MNPVTSIGFGCADPSAGCRRLFDGSCSSARLLQRKLTKLTPSTRARRAGSGMVSNKARRLAAIVPPGPGRRPRYAKEAAVGQCFLWLAEEGARQSPAGCPYRLLGGVGRAYGGAWLRR